MTRSDASGATGREAVEEADTVAVSVVIPHLNQPEHLERCLATLQAQERIAPDRFEVIVVDNGSRALPQEICDRHGVRLLTEARPGPGPARNAGAEVARGPVLAFIDADCTADPGWLFAILQRFEDPRTRVIGGDVRIARERPDAPTMLEAYESVFAFRMREYIARQGFTGTGNLAVRREVFEAVGPFAGIDVAEDRDWGQRALAQGIATTYAPEMRVFHPARKAFPEIFAKWSRHIGHDRVRAGAGAVPAAKWLLRAVAVAVSPIAEIPRIARSDRVSGWRERLMAWLAVIRVRAYRARVMLGVLRVDAGKALASGWNRD